MSDLRDVVKWEDSTQMKEVKKLYAKDLTEMEFEIFINIGKSTGLNPFLREIWAVKYGNQAAAIFIGRDGYRKSAQASSDYDWHFVESIHENDVFEINGGEVVHKMDMKNRGKVTGAYCLCKRKGSSRPNYHRVDFSEYTTGRSLWAATAKPVTMIKKVAEAQGLRMTFQELFAGTYEESEDWKVDEVEREIKTPPKNVVKEVGKKAPVKAASADFVEAEAEEEMEEELPPEEPEIISDDDVLVVLNLLMKLGYNAKESSEKVAAFEKHFKKKLAQLTKKEGGAILTKLRAQLNEKLEAQSVEDGVEYPEDDGVQQDPPEEAMDEETEESYRDRVNKTISKKQAGKSDEDMMADLAAKKRAMKGSQD